MALIFAAIGRSYRKVSPRSTARSGQRPVLRQQSRLPQRFQPGERGFFDDGLCEVAHAPRSASKLMISRTIKSLLAGALSAMSKASAVSACGLSWCAMPSCCR